MSRLVGAFCWIAFSVVAVIAPGAERPPTETIRERPAPRTEAAVKADAVLGSDRHAVVIGVNDYTDEGIPDLRMAEADARAVHSVLTDPAIGGVPARQAALLLGRSATTREVKRAINRLKTLPARSTIFIYFSGHGMTESGDGYWLTQDAEANDLAASAVSDTEIRKLLGDIRAERLLVMIDACYASATVNGTRDAPKSLQNVLGKFTGKGHAVLSAAGNGEEALEANDLHHSVFTYYLLEGLRGKADVNDDGVVVLPELTDYLDAHVSDEARRRKGIQKPVVDMKSVQEPARFQIVIDATRLAVLQKATARMKANRERQLLKLRELSLDENLTVEQYREGKRLLEADPGKLSTRDQSALKEYERVLDGQLAPDKLTRALELIADRPSLSVRRPSFDAPISNAAAPISNAAAVPDSPASKIPSKFDP